MATERRKIPGFDSRYTVDEKGRLYNDDCRIYGTIDSLGYRSVSILTTDGKYRNVRIHRLVALAWVPGRDAEHDTVDHINADKLDNRAENLRWVSASENGKLAAYEQGLHARKPVRVKATRVSDPSECQFFRGIAEAAKELSINYWHIHAIVHGTDPSRHSAGGWRFETA